MTTLYTTTTQHINQKMDIEFHYYVTYLVYIKAGFNKNEAEIIAYASQYVDDNTAQAYVKSRGSGAIVYRSMITQTYDITLPKSIMHQIYIAFHFIPGFSSQSHSTDMHRKDGKKHHMMTVAGSVPSRILMYSALQSGDLYWIGIATHAFLDTWAHQNFTGTMDDFNGFSDIKSIVIPNIGHADAMSAPDELCRKWCDPRLKNPKIDNNKRFLEAAFSLFSILFEVKKPNISKQNLILEWEIIEQDLITIWNTHCTQRFFSARERRNRIAEYSKIAIKYSGSPILEYDKFAWKREALTSVIGQYVYRWRDAELYRTTHWFCFQVAAVKQLEFVKNLLQAYSAYHLLYPSKIGLLRK